MVSVLNMMGAGNNRKRAMPDEDGMSPGIDGGNGRSTN